MFEGPPAFQIWGLMLSSVVQICISPLYIRVIIVASSTLPTLFICHVFSPAGMRNHKH